MGVGGVGGGVGWGRGAGVVSCGVVFCDVCVCVCVCGVCVFGDYVGYVWYGIVNHKRKSRFRIGM